MARIIFTLAVILFTSGSLQAQIHISANLIQYGKFNRTKNLYDSSFKDNAGLTTFEFDKDFTILSHTTDSKTSTYLIISKKKDEANVRWEFDIISDSGYSYFMIIDILNKNIRFIYRANGYTYLTQLAIDRFWIDS